MKRTFEDPAARGVVEGELGAMGALSGGALYEMQLAGRTDEPSSSRGTRGGSASTGSRRPRSGRRRAARGEKGVVAAAYENKRGPRPGRQFTLVHLFHPSTDVYTCPLAMTDGAARDALLGSGDTAPAIAPRRAPEAHEPGPRPGLDERTVDDRVDRGLATSGAPSPWPCAANGRNVAAPRKEVLHLGRRRPQMALTLARPEGTGRVGDGLALFYLELRDDGGPAPRGSASTASRRSWGRGSSRRRSSRSTERPPSPSCGSPTA